VVGALATAELARLHGTRAVLGGVTWERRAIDARPGPRALAELLDAEPLNDVAALAGPETRTEDGVAFAESRVAGVLGERTLLVDPGPGPGAVAAGLAEATERLDCDLVAMVDVGGDALARGDEAGLASPLCDAILLAAAEPLAAAGPRVVGGVFGAGCDGELTVDEVLERMADLAAAGALLGARGLSPAAAQLMEAAVDAVPTEASAQALACARGARGRAEIRGGRRTVERTPVGAITFYFDAPAAVAAAAPLARAVRDATDLEDANRRLHAVGVRTELDLERGPPR
jgi:hypothetical protein